MSVAFGPMAEAGIDHMETGAWFGLFAPRGTPAAIVQKLNAVMNEILKEKEVRGAFEKLRVVEAHRAALRRGGRLRRG